MWLKTTGVIAACLVVVASANWAAFAWFDAPLTLPASSSPVSTASPSSSPTPKALPVAALSPGAASALAALSSYSLDSAPQWPAWCPQVPSAAWLASGKDKGFSSAVAVTPAGLGTMKFGALVSGLASCEGFSLSSFTPDTVTLYRPDVNLYWTVATDRDVAVSVYSLDSNQTKEEANRILRKAVAGCAVPVGDQAGRNPFLAGYEQYSKNQTLVLAAPEKDFLPVSSKGSSLWKPPAPVAHDSLAPLVPPTSTSNGTFTPAQLAPRLPAPVYVSPASIVEPEFPRPDFVKDSLSLPNLPSAYSKVSVPVSDEVGPGCGWAYTGSSPPEPVDLSTAQMAAQQAALETKVRKLGNWFATAAALTMADPADILTSRQAAAWRRYDAALERALADQQRAREAYDASVYAWEHPPVASPEPSADPSFETPTEAPSTDPSTGPTAEPTPEPTPSPQPPAPSEAPTPEPVAS